jgi:hypothetical protein
MVEISWVSNGGGVQVEFWVGAQSTVEAEFGKTPGVEEFNPSTNPAQRKQPLRLVLFLRLNQNGNVNLSAGSVLT